MRPSTEIIDGKYTLQDKLGGGGFSNVYRVEGAGGVCAIKLLKGAAGAMKPSVLEEFKNEFAILKDMRHPHIAEILDFGYDETIGQYYYTTELIEGSDLFRATETLTFDETCDLFVQALRALEYLHAYRIYHFDIKSANVLVTMTPTPSVKIIDFGLAGFDPRGKLIGTPSYMPPEIVAREHADGRADLYSLGVLWYYCLARTNPFRATSTQETLERQRKLIPPPPSTKNLDVPAWCDRIIGKLLEKNPANRYATAAAVIHDINRLGGKTYTLETRETLLSYIPEEGRFIGREKDLILFDEALDLLKQDEGEPTRGFLLTGALGTGKSRLLHEIKFRFQLKDVHVCYASARSPDEMNAWRDELAQHLADGHGVHVFLLDDVEALLLEEVSRAQLLALLSRTRRPPSGARVLIFLAMGEDVAEAHRATLENLLDEGIMLSPFDRNELEEYLISLTGLIHPPDLLLEEILRRTDGNPLFVTELIKSLIVGGALFDEHGRWIETLFEDVGVDFSKAQIPETIGGLLLQRIGALPEEQRRLLEALAIADEPTQPMELAHWGQVENPQQAIAELLRSGLVERREALAIDFGNALLRTVLCDALPEARRCTLHDRLASALRESNTEPNRICLHECWGSDKQVALTAAKKLGDASLTAGRGREAATFLEHALSLTPPENLEPRIELTMKLGEAMLIARDYDAAHARFSAIESMLCDAQATPQTARWNAEALTRLGGTYIKLQEFERARHALMQAKRALNASGGDPVQELVIENFLAGILFQEGKLDVALNIFERTRAAAIDLASMERVHVTNNDLGMVLVAQGDADKAQAIFSDDLAQAVAIEDDLLVARAHYNLAQVAYAKNDYVGAIDAFERCVEICRRSQNTELLLRAYNGMGNAYQLMGNLDQSLAFYDRGLTLHERVGDLRGGAAIAVNMGLIETQRGKTDAALDHLVPAIAYLRALPEKGVADWTALARALLEMGDILHRDGKLDEARMQLEESRSIATRVPQASSYRFWILATLAEIANDQSQGDEFSALVERLRPLALGDEERKTLEALEQKRRESPLPAKEQTTAPPEEAWPPKTDAQESASNPWRRILEINKLIAGERDLDYVLKTVLFYALDLTSAEGGAILLADDAGEVHITASRNMAGTDEETAISRTLAGQAIATGQPVRTDDAMIDARFSEEVSIAAQKLRSILALPIRARGQIVGVLYLHNRFQTSAFADSDMTILDAFSDQAGLAIETARLIEASTTKETELSHELAEASRRAHRYEELLHERNAAFAFEPGTIVAASPAMQRIQETMGKIADTDLAVFICGESGTGKELIARALHQGHAMRRNGRFIAINCGAIPATLIESELFGYRKGAFTGASRDKPGLIEEAHGGTLFLDEIGELEPSLQVKLLRVLQEGEVTRLGATAVKTVDLRVVAASNRDMDALRAEGRFRDDLYYRICQITVALPPLRERPEDITALTEVFLARYGGNRHLTIEPKLMRRMLTAAWPGNVRELENFIQVVCAITEGAVIGIDTIPDNHPLAKADAVPTPTENPEPKIASALPEMPPIGDHGVLIDGINAYDPTRPWKEYERLIVAACFSANDRRARPTARELGIAASTMYKHIETWDLKSNAASDLRNTFIYTRGRTLAQYVPLIFRAALAAANGNAARTIANLGISQGFFYKVMKKKERTEG